MNELNFRRYKWRTNVKIEINSLFHIQIQSPLLTFLDALQRYRSAAIRVSPASRNLRCPPYMNRAMVLISMWVPLNEIGKLALM